MTIDTLPPSAVLAEGSPHANHQPPWHLCQTTHDEGKNSITKRLSAQYRPNLKGHLSSLNQDGTMARACQARALILLGTCSTPIRQWLGRACVVDLEHPQSQLHKCNMEKIAKQLILNQF
jgi:hypothetical protein